MTTSRYPPRPAEDERIAPLVAAAAVCRTRIPQRGSRFASEIAKNWATHLCADEHAWFVHMIGTLGSRPAVLYDGLGGALSCPSRCRRVRRSPSSKRTHARAGRSIGDRLQRAFGGVSRACCAPTPPARSRELAVNRIAAELDRHMDAPDPIKSFNFWNRIRRELALSPYGLMKHVPTVYTPYLDHDLYDFLMGVPATVVSPELIPSDKPFHTDAIHRAFPEYAHLPYENKSAPRLDPAAHDQQFAREAGWFIVRNTPHKTQLMNRAYVLPRAAYASVRSTFGRIRPWFAGISLYLTQLEMVLDDRFPRRSTSSPAPRNARARHPDVRVHRAAPRRAPCARQPRGTHRSPVAARSASSDVFAEWNWDGNTLAVRNDPWGFQPLFYSASADRIAVATSIPRLLELGVPADLDEAALAVFLRLSHFLFCDSPFKAIRALPRDGRLTWTGGALRVSSASVAPAADRLSKPSIVDGYITLFRQAVERRLPAGDERVIAPLSGGRDSRHVLFELVAQRCRPIETVTIHHYPPKGNDDARVAPMVAAAAGVPNVVLPLDWQRVQVEKRKNVMTSFCADRHAQMLPLVDYLRGRADVIYDGLGGDILSGARIEQADASLALFQAGRCDELARKTLTAHSDEAALQAVLQPEARRRFGFEIAAERLAEELRRHRVAEPWGSFRCANRTARSVAQLPFGMLSRACRVITPYLDRDLTRFLTSLPVSSIADGRLHTEAIARAFLQHAHLRYEDPAEYLRPRAGLLPASVVGSPARSVETDRLSARPAAFPGVSRGEVGGDRQRSLVRAPPRGVSMQLEEVLDGPHASRAAPSSEQLVAR